MPFESEDGMSLTPDPQHRASSLRPGCGAGLSHAPCVNRIARPAWPRRYTTNSVVVLALSTEESMSLTTQHRRRHFIEGLRAVASFYEQNADAYYDGMHIT